MPTVLQYSEPVSSGISRSGPILPHGLQSPHAFQTEKGYGAFTGQNFGEKFKITCQKIYPRYRTTIETKDGTDKVLQVTVEGETSKPLITYFGRVSLGWNKWVKINDNRQNLIWNGRSEVV